MGKTFIPYFIGLDIGTSSAKAVAFSPDGRVLTQAARHYPILRPEPEAAVQEPEKMRLAALASLQEVVHQRGKPPEAIGLSSAMHSLLAVDEKGTALTPLFSWADGRARSYAEALRPTAQGQYLYRRSGTPIHAMSLLGKIARLREQETDIFQNASYFVGIKDYLLFHCFGNWWIDHSLASATGLFDLKKRDWIPEALSYTGIGNKSLPCPVPVRYVLTGLPESLAALLGLQQNTPWIIGGSDGCLANLGAGLSKSNEAALSIGTSGAIRVTSPEIIYDAQERLFCYILDESQYVVGGPTNNGGVVWEWFCRQFFPDQTMGDIFNLVAQVPAGAEGLLFLPYLYGERAPVWDAAAKGHFWGIKALHTRAHFARAVLEGICLNLYQITEALESLCGPIEMVHASGGFTRSDLWVQMLADIFGKKMLVGETAHASAWGAAILAMKAVGYPLPQTGPKADVIKSFVPNKDRHDQYQIIYDRFKQIYPSAKVS